MLLQKLRPNLEKSYKNTKSTPKNEVLFIFNNQKLLNGCFVISNWLLVTGH
jgi:hypothetical protein